MLPVPLYGEEQDPTSVARGHSLFSMPSTLPWFPMYAVDWLALRLTAEQKGALSDMRCVAWLADPPCTLPNDEAQLAEISGLRERWETVGKPLRAMLVRVADFPDRLLDKALFEVYCKQTARRSAGRSGGLARSKQNPSNGQANGKHGFSGLSNILSLSNDRAKSIEQTQAKPEQTASIAQATGGGDEIPF